MNTKLSRSSSEPMLILRLFTGEECSIVHAGKVRQSGPFSQRAEVQPRTES